MRIQQMLRNITLGLCFALGGVLAGPNALVAEEPPTPEQPAEPETPAKSTNAAAQANNPLANLTALNFQNYYIGELTESDENAFQTIVRFAKPFSLGKTNWLFRGSAPFQNLPTGEDDSKQFGLGDIDAFAAYLMDTGNPARSFGIGPNILVPTASDDELGGEKLAVGITNVLFDATSKKFQFGYLFTTQHSVGGEGSRDNFNKMAFQPFGFYQLGEGWYLRAAPIWSYNIDEDTYSVPVGAGLGKVIKDGKNVYNLFVEPQYSVADDGAGLPEWQVFFSLNMQFY